MTSLLDGDPAIGAVVVRDAALDRLPGIFHGFSTRRGGVSTGRRAALDFGKDLDPSERGENLRRLAARVGFEHDRLFTVRQVHGGRVVEVDGRFRKEAIAREEADALFTAVPGLGLGIVTADCVPVLFADRRGRAVAAAHAGWRGLVAGILEEAVASFGRHGISSEDLVVAIGPHIGGAAYEVGDEVAQYFVSLDAALGGGVAILRGTPRPHLDLGAIVQAKLTALGIRALQRTPYCTARDAALFFSHRRDPSGGRQLSVIGMNGALRRGRGA